MQDKKKSFLKWIIIVNLLSFLLMGIFLFFLNLPADSVNQGKKVEIFIGKKQQSPFKFITKELNRKKIIKNVNYFYYLGILLGIDKKVRSGYYLFDSTKTSFEILEKINQGKIEYFSFTIYPGNDYYEIYQHYLNHHTNMVKIQEKSFLNINPKIMHSISETSFELYRQVNQHKTLEGLLYPDTYTIKKGFAPEDLKLSALNNSLEKFNDYLHKKDFYKYLIIASLIEKETSLQSEKALISSVIHNRLKINEKLRIDPTILYSIKLKGIKDENLRDGKINIRKEDFYLSSPWNTYYKKGLPPTPICNPTLSSLIAAYQPEKTDYLFFVAKGKNQVGHYFSKTYEEHKKFIKLYLKTLRHF